jgi:hypothetical protein
MTLKEVAAATGAKYRTVARYAHEAGWTHTGILTRLDEVQVTLMTEAMKAPVSSGTKAHLASQLQGVETSMSRELRLAEHYKAAAALERELKEDALHENHLLAMRNDALIAGNADLMRGLGHAQMLLENSGRIMSDRDDINAMYGRKL